VDHKRLRFVEMAALPGMATAVIAATYTEMPVGG
jgi:hypothetical protein